MVPKNDPTQDQSTRLTSSHASRGPQGRACAAAACPLWWHPVTPCGEHQPGCAGPHAAVAKGGCLQVKLDPHRPVFCGHLSVHCGRFLVLTRSARGAAGGEAGTAQVGKRPPRVPLLPLVLTGPCGQHGVPPAGCQCPPAECGQALSVPSGVTSHHQLCGQQAQAPAGA